MSLGNVGVVCEKRLLGARARSARGNQQTNERKTSLERNLPHGTPGNRFRR
jgi:hypothetical protein